MILVLALAASAAVTANESSYRFTVQFSPSRISWNPHYAYTTTEAQIFTALYEGLVTFHPATLRPIPGAAESWDISEDGTVITFHLRDGLFWSNGERLTSMDFRDSWLTLLSPKTGAEYASMLDDVAGAREYRTGSGSSEDVGLETPDAKTLIVTLKQPTPQFLSILCHYSFTPVHRDFRNEPDWSALKSVPVNGPYIIRARNENEILLDKNPKYWDADSLTIKALRILFLNDPAEVMRRFNRFEIDWIVSGMDTSLLSGPESLIIAPLFSTTYYYFSNNGTAWADGNIRRALCLLLPWDEIRGNRFIPGTSLVPPIPNYPESSAGFPDVAIRAEQALSLLEAAGYPGGRGLPSLTIKVPQEDPVAEVMMKTWKEALGMDVRIETVTFPDYYDSINEKGYDIATLTWTGDYADPYTFLGMWDSKSSFNESGFSDTEFDAMLRESALLPYIQRLNKLKEAEDRLLYSCQVMPIEHFPAVNIIDRRFIEGWFPNALDIHPFKDIMPKLGYNIPGVVMAD